MFSTAEWVPTEAASYLEPLLIEAPSGNEAPDTSNIIEGSKKFDILFWWQYGHLNDFRETVQTLLTRESMRETWNTISRRSDIASPDKFCAAFYELFRSSVFFDRAGDEEEIILLESLEQLRKDAEKLLTQYGSIFNKDYCGEPIWNLSPPPEEYLQDFVLTIQGRVANITERIAFQRRFSLRLGHPSAKRTHLLRLMSDALRAIYGQRLHAVTAACVCLVLGEDHPLDESHVAKVVNDNARHRIED